MGDYPVLTAVKNLPTGMQSATATSRPSRTRRRTRPGATRIKRNRTSIRPTGRGRTPTAMQFLEAAPRRPTRSTARRSPTRCTGLTIDCPFGADGTVTMREDQTIDRLRHRLGHDDPAGALHRRHQGRRLGQDLRTRDRVEEAEELHLSRAARDGPRSPLGGCLDEIRLPGDADHQRPDHRHAAVPGRRRADADLRRAQDGQFRPRHVLHAGRLFRLQRVSAQPAATRWPCCRARWRRRCSACSSSALLIGRVYGQTC